MRKSCLRQGSHIAGHTGAIEAAAGLLGAELVGQSLSGGRVLDNIGAVSSGAVGGADDLVLHRPLGPAARTAT